MNFLDGGAYEYGTSKVAVNYGNLLLGSFTRNSTGYHNPGIRLVGHESVPFPTGTSPFSPAWASEPISTRSTQHTTASLHTIWSGISAFSANCRSQMFLSANYAGNRANHCPRS